MVATYFDSTEVAIKGANLGVGQMTAIARRPMVQVVLAAANAKVHVDESSYWVLQKIINGKDIYDVTTSFGATSMRM